MSAWDISIAAAMLPADSSAMTTNAVATGWWYIVSMLQQRQGVQRRETAGDGGKNICANIRAAAVAKI